MLLFESIYHGENLRLVGVSLNNVVHLQDINIQLSLFHSTQSQIQKETPTDQLISQLNENLSDTKVMKASSLIKNQDIQKKYLKNNE